MACINLNLDINVNHCLSGLWTSLRQGRPKSGIENLKKEMQNLSDKRDDMKSSIDQAELEGRIPTKQVNQWLLDMETLEGQVADIEKDFQSMSCFSFHCFNQTRTGGMSQAQQAGDQVPIREPSNYYSIIRRVSKMLGEANKLMDRAKGLDPIAKVQPQEPIVMLPISDQPPIGIESYVKDISSCINGGEGNVIGIYGMGGVGKTTLLNSIQQHYYRNQSIFDCFIWVVASKDCKLKKLQMDIAKSQGLKTLEESDEEQTCGNKLFIYLKKRNCLLFLDDIWEHLDLRLLGMAHSASRQGQQRKVVVFTTRSETVCTQMKAQKKIKVRCLDPNQAWQLFLGNSDVDILRSDKEINSYAKQLAKECAGLPRALITVAQAMLGNKPLVVWKDALQQITNNHEWTTNGHSEDSLIMHKARKLSCYILENDFMMMQETLGDLG
ncbi:hypothetical protein ZIOFF_033337 [Zingiber officinale]|uniref:AAA+ ATPase domain-containing protein n=1 Tax=Zingiber officinale TaxID=94328 RepID=A0A8J5LCF5_ZINOF|nr:hypothetical protein ZIOFF_033337 [Zingiber officinale]